MSFRGPRICQYPLESGKLKQLTNDVKAKIWNLHGTEEREAYVQAHVRRCLKDFTKDVWPRFGPLALTRVVASITSEKLITSEKPAEASTVEEGAGEPEVHLPGILEAIQRMSDEATIWEDYLDKAAEALRRVLSQLPTGEATTSAAYEVGKRLQQHRMSSGTPPTSSARASLPPSQKRANESTDDSSDEGGADTMARRKKQARGFPAPTHPIVPFPEPKPPAPRVVGGSGRPPLFSAEEDAAIWEGVSTFGNKWTTIRAESNGLLGRWSGTAIKDRYGVLRKNGFCSS